MNSIKEKSRGGKRAGAGRKPGSRDLATHKEVLSIAALAKTHAHAAIATLAHVMAKGESEAARVSAATHILDRGYGRVPAADDRSGATEIHLHLDDRLANLG